MTKSDSRQPVLNDKSYFRDGNTLFAPNEEGEIVAHHVVNMTSEIVVPGSSDKVNITGTVEQVIAYINTNFPDYEWPDVEDLNDDMPKISAEDNTVYCNVGDQGYYYTATLVMSFLRHFGGHTVNVGGGPAACATASCQTDSGGNLIAFWFCNDVSVRTLMHAISMST